MWHIEPIGIKKGKVEAAIFIPLLSPHMQEIAVMTVLHPMTTSTGSSLHLIFDDISWDLHSNFISPHCEQAQTIRVVEEIRTDKVYCGKFYKGNYAPGKRATREVVIKVAGPTSSEEDFQCLEWEDIIYHRFSNFQGTIFPDSLGIFRAYGSDGRTTMMCLVLEKCTPSANYDKDEFNRQLMVAVCKLHDANLIHNGLLNKSHILRQGNSPRIVDLSQARIHVCRGCHPADHLGTISEEFRSCWELVELEKRIWNDHDIEDEKPSSYISQIVEVGSNYLSKGFGAIMRN